MIASQETKPPDAVNHLSFYTADVKRKFAGHPVVVVHR